MRQHRWTLGLAVAFSVAAFAPSSQVEAGGRERTYTITDLGTLGGPESEARAINSSGVIVGNAMTPAAIPNAVKWENKQIIDLGVPPGGLGGIGSGINDSGVIVGGGLSAVDQS